MKVQVINLGSLDELFNLLAGDNINGIPGPCPLCGRFHPPFFAPDGFEQGVKTEDIDHEIVEPLKLTNGTRPTENTGD